MDAARTGSRRTWPQRLLITFNCVLVALSVAGAGSLGWFYTRFGELPRVDFAEGVLIEEPPGEPENYLLVGSDTRAFTAGDADAAASFGDEASVAGQRADTIILIRVDPREETAAMMSFPRDLWVDLAGEGRRGRINTAFEGGPEQLVRTITESFGIPIHHYVQVDFQGFKGLVDAVDGVEVFLPAPVRDRAPDGTNPSGLDITDAGCVSLSGDQALSYVRSRHFQELIDGEWRADPSGDLGRIARQQDFIRRAMKEAISKDLLNPGKLNELVDVGVDNVTIDRDLDARDLVGLGKRFRSLTPESLQQYSLPVEGGRVGEASVLFLQDGPEAQGILDVFRGVRPAGPVDVAPSAVTVRVLNGTGTPGQAAGARDGLMAAGFTVVGVGDGNRSGVTTVRYGAGQLPKAALLARYLEPEAQLVEDPSLVGVDAVVLTGSTFSGIRAEPRPPAEPPAPGGPAPTPAPPDGAPAEPPATEC